MEDSTNTRSKSNRPTFIAVAIQPAVVRRALGYAVVVGAVLVAINHGDVLLAGLASPKLLMKIGLTFCVPYCVSTASSVGAIRNSSA